MGIAYYKTGDKNKTALFLYELLNRINKSPLGSPSFYTAALYAAMDDKDKAIQFLERGYSNHEVEMYWLKVEPLFKSLHGDPRFEDLLGKIGFQWDHQDSKKSLHSSEQSATNAKSTGEKCAVKINYLPDLFIFNKIF